MRSSTSGPNRRALLAWAAGAGLALPARGLVWPRLPPLAPRQRRLANGLSLLALPMEDSASVAVQLWYRVGGKDDPPGRSGFAHLFEHMMFKGTRHMAAEQFDRLTEDVGGSNNAFTAEDMTVYHSVVPAHHLEPLLWAEAERMANLNVDQAAFDSERAVVKEEYRQRVLADPYGRLFNAIPVYGYQQHAYQRPVIGHIEELDAATLTDLRAFHAGFYRPDNAVLIVAGAFDPGQLEAWVEHYFGSIPLPRAPVPRRESREPRRTRDELHRLTAPGVPQPAALAIWQGPRADAEEVPALQLAQALLAQGDAARLNEALVNERPLAQSVGFELMLNAEAGLLAAHAIAAGTTRPEALLAALTREIHRVAEEPLATAELDKAKAQLLTQALVERETPEGRALALGNALLLRGDALAAERDLVRLQAVGAEELQRALRRHVLQGARVALLYGPGEGAAR
ncbi:insulinase family protein [Roseateles sp. DAIF2]|uniref:M16 family metallopeptidase n=1 Tax=Roseateles sp. DAIF2 TaxID=2714952 RepID=UPI0018A2AE86|nr:pitrilysin family protein [Roseateles sp. DAIF2]QPF71872.1 insulinase family protein [Roseateles sp. DAIF2]